MDGPLGLTIGVSNRAEGSMSFAQPNVLASLGSPESTSNCAHPWLLAVRFAGLRARNPIAPAFPAVFRSHTHTPNVLTLCRSAAAAPRRFMGGGGHDDHHGPTTLEPPFQRLPLPSGPLPEVR